MPVPITPQAYFKILMIALAHNSVVKTFVIVNFLVNNKQMLLNGLFQYGGLC